MVHIFNRFDYVFLTNLVLIKKDGLVDKEYQTKCVLDKKFGLPDKIM